MELGFPVNFPTNLPPKWRHLPPQKWRFFKVDTTGFEISMAEPSGNDGTLEANFSITFLVICGHNSDKFVNFLHHVHLCSLFILIYLGFVWESLKRRLKLIQGGPQNSEPRISWRQNLRETLIFFGGKPWKTNKNHGFRKIVPTKPIRWYMVPLILDTPFFVVTLKLKRILCPDTVAQYPHVEMWNVSKRSFVEDALQSDRPCEFARLNCPG